MAERRLETKADRYYIGIVEQSALADVIALWQTLYQADPGWSEWSKWRASPSLVRSTIQLGGVRYKWTILYSISRGNRFERSPGLPEGWPTLDRGEQVYFYGPKLLEVFGSDDLPLCLFNTHVHKYRGGGDETHAVASSLLPTALERMGIVAWETPGPLIDGLYDGPVGAEWRPLLQHLSQIGHQSGKFIWTIQEAIKLFGLQNSPPGPGELAEFLKDGNVRWEEDEQGVKFFGLKSVPPGPREWRDLLYEMARAARHGKLPDLPVVEAARCDPPPPPDSLQATTPDST